MSSSGLRVAVVGAGIVCLTLAIALRRLGVEVEVFEQAPELGEIGAAVGLSANGIRLLRRPGVEEALTTAMEPTELQFRRWDSGDLIWSHPVAEGGWYRERCGAPWYGIHRKDLQQALIDRLGQEVIHLSHKFVDVSEEAGRGDAGVREGRDRVRPRRGRGGRHPLPAARASDRRRGRGGILPGCRLSRADTRGEVAVPAGSRRDTVLPGGHLLHYAIDGGKTVNFLAVH